MGVSTSERDMQWKRALGTLPDSVFLNLMRNYLGKIPTPFHKPQLIERLTTLFSNSQFIDRVFSCITDWDARILTAAWMYGEVTQDELCALFVDDVPYIVIQQSVVNLEERLLLIPSPEQHEQRKTIVTNPLFTERFFAQKVFSLPLLLANKGENPHSARFTPMFDHRILRALFSLHIHDTIPPAEKGQRYLRNPSILSIFSARPTEQTALYLPILERILIRLEVVKEATRETVLNIPRSTQLLSLEPYALQQLFLREFSRELSLCSHPDEQQISYGAFLGHIYSIMGKFESVDALALRKILYISAAKASLHIQRYRELAQLLIDMGIISQPYGNHPSYAIARPSAGGHHMMSHTFTIDSDFTVTVSGDPRTKDGIDILHLLCRVEKLDTMCNYRLNRESYRHAIDSGCTLELIIDYIQEMTGKPIPKGLLTALEHWNEESDSIRIYDGITVKADQRIARLIEALPSLHQHRITTITNGCYLFSRKTEPIWRQILSDASSVLLPQSITEEATGHDSVVNEPLDLDVSETTQVSIDNVMQPFVSDQAHQEPAFINELKKHIGTMHMSRYDQEDLLARVDKRLILTSTQIVPQGSRSGVQSASGFDFQGKLNLIKATVASSNEMLELHVVQDEGDVRKLLVEAKELIGGNRDYTLRVSVLPEREEKIINADKIFLVRRLRRSVFFQ